MYLNYLLNTIYHILFDSEINNATSYYPEIGTRKKKAAIIIDQFKHFVKNHAVNNFYFLYGLDRNNFRNESDYVDNYRFIRRRNKLNLVNSPNSHILILRDKFIFGIVASTLNISTPENIGINNKTNFYLIQDKRNTDFIEFLKYNNIDAFLKLINGECGKGIYHIKSLDKNIYVNNNLVQEQSILSELKDEFWILQKRITQHDELSRLYPQSINTIRLVTINNQGKINILPPLLRVGTNGNNIDNWAAGGLAVMIDTDNNCLGRYGFYKPSYGTKTTFHPNTKIEFKGYKIPFLQDAIAQAIKFHTFLPSIHSIGWDIAITSSGPCFIEGNDNWEISLMQVCSHGLQTEFKNWF